MKSHLRVPLAVLTVAVCGGLAWRGSAQNVVISGEPPPVRELRDLPAGSGLVLGRTLDADSRQPVPGVMVTLTRVGESVRPAAVLTDSQGRFVFRDLPKGGFWLSATKTGYVNGRYGKHLAESGLNVINDREQLQLAERERRGDVVIQMWEHAAIGGTVRDERGEPIVGITVRALAVSYAGGRARYGFESTAAGASVQTDDRGMFRLSALIPGEYVVAVPVVFETIPRSLARTPAWTGSQASPTFRDSYYPGSDWIGSGLSTRVLDSPDPAFGPAASSRSPTIAGVSRDGRLLVYEMQFHPQVATLDRAMPVRLRSGEERSAIDFHLRPVPAVQISGRVAGPDGPVAGLALGLLRADAALMTSERAIARTVTDADGTFAFLGITPGEYTVSALITPRPAARRPAIESGTTVVSGGGTSVTMIAGPIDQPLPTEPTHWASQQISVGDRDLRDVALTLRQGARLSGRVELRGATPGPMPSYYQSFYVERADGTQSPNLNLLLGRIDTAGRFASFGQPPGRYFLRVPSASATTSGWYFAGAMLGDRDLSRTPIELSDRDVDGIVLVFRDQPGAELTGMVRAEAGDVEYRAAVVVFPVDRASWGAMGRHPRDFRSAGVLGGGRYVVSDLPAGEYFVAALPEARPDWADGTSLEKLAGTAARVTLGDREKRALNLTLPRQAGIAGGMMPAVFRPPDMTRGFEDTRLQPGDDGDEPQGQATGRDARPAAGAGTGVVAGAIVTGERREPMRRAHVVLSGAALPGTRVVMTDDEGRFAFNAVPAGRFTLSAEKAAYLTATYGASRPGRPGTPITLADAERMDGITLVMARGAVITGTIRDGRGQPLGNAPVQLLHDRFVNGARRLMPYNSGAFFNMATDDRGMYRFYAVEPGEYAVAAGHRSGGQSAREITAGDVEAAEALLRGGPSRPTAMPQPSGAGTSAPATPTTVVYAPVYFPGTADPTQVRLIAVTDGQEVSGIDFVVEAVPAASIRGVVTPVGEANLDVRLVNATASASPGPMLTFLALSPIRPAPDGTFQFTGIAPGQYTIVATTSDRVARGAAPGAASGARMWATASVIVAGADISGIVLTLQPAMTVSGTIAFDAMTLTPPAPGAVRLSLTPLVTGSDVSVAPSQIAIDADGSFVAHGLMPGRYVPRALLPAGAQGWITRSAMLAGTDVMDTGFEVGPGESVRGLTLTFTDRAGEIGGTLQDASGRPAPDYFIILFPADASLWRAGARRIQQVRPDTSGRFIFRNLVAGSYHLAALTDVMPGEWLDPAFLAQLAGGAITLQLAEGETKTQDIQIRR
jgi:protocatechuate 3,4-dioxygenase beta subunit